jgi:putative Mg2+ transporter-C (MgtC) family protein
MPIWEAGLNLIAAVGLGAAIGLERQWRQRLAGLRTNTLVALGAASFILFSRLTDHDEGAARVGAQVVSGIGFLGAGVIFKEGLNVRGLNTAATLWCSAAVGLLAGMGFHIYAILCAALVVGSNLVLRPLVQLVNRQPVDTTEVERAYVATIVCRAADAEQVRVVLMEGLREAPDLHFNALEIVNLEESDRVEIRAVVASLKRREIALETVIGRLARERGVFRASWRAETQSM